MEAFVGPRLAGFETLHADGNAANNHLSNLSYGTSRENSYDIVRHGRNRNANKTHCNHGHEFTEANTYRQSSGGRGCVECSRRVKRESARRRHQARREAA